MTINGKEIREKFFKNLDPEVTPTNHGSYGLTPDPIFEKFVRALETDNSFPDLWSRYSEITSYLEAVKVLGKFLNCDYKKLAVVDSATVAINTVLRSLSWEKDDVIVVASTIYGATLNSCKFLGEKFGVKVVTIDLDYPLEDSKVIELFEDAFKKYSPKLCVFDTVSSMPGVLVPFVELTKLCKQHGVMSLIDGAHSIGLIPLDLEFDPDFFLSNLHKWLFVPKGCCVLYVARKFFKTIQSMPISHSYVSEDTELTKEEEDDLLIHKFTFVGTKYYANLLCIKAAIEFREKELGGERAIYDYCFPLATKIGEGISKKWDSSYLENSTKTLTTAMVNVEIPIERFAKECGADFDMNDKVQWSAFEQYILQTTVQEDKTILPMIRHNGKLYCRLSAQVYTTYEDFDKATDLFSNRVKKYLSNATSK